MNYNVEKLLKDNRLCASNNMKKFFRSHKGKGMANNLEIIRFEGKLWFVTLGWLVTIGNENGFAGVTVSEVACYGNKATTGYPSWQNGNDYEVVTDWFWKQYWTKGMVSIPEVWTRFAKPIYQKSHSESHTI